MVIQAGENVPAAAFVLNGHGGVLEVLLQVVVGPEVFPTWACRRLMCMRGGGDSNESVSACWCFVPVEDLVPFCSCCVTINT